VEIEEANKGYYDEFDFFMMAAGDFYDPNGYYFDEMGYDEYDGYYEGLYYVPGE